MKISKNFYLSLLLLSVGLIFVFCLKIIFFPSINKSPASNNNSIAPNNKSILETNTKYFDEIYSEYKKLNQPKNDLLTEKQFSNILHCFFVIFQLEPIDYGEMLIYILEKNPSLVDDFSLKSTDKLKTGFVWLFKLNNDSFYEDPLLKKGDQSAFINKFENIKSEIRNHFKHIEKSKNLKKFNEFKNDVNAIFNSDKFDNQHLQNILPLFDIRITDEDIFIYENNILLKPALLHAIYYIKLNWSKTLSADMIDNVFPSDLTAPKGTFSYFYISFYSWLYFKIHTK